MLYAGRVQAGRFQLGEGDEFSVIAAAVLGGTSLFGGQGTAIGTIVGAMMIGLINNGLILMGLEFSQQLVARGGIIILAVALSQKKIGDRRRLEAGRVSRGKTALAPAVFSEHRLKRCGYRPVVLPGPALLFPARRDA